MSASTAINLALVVLCLCVLVQSIRIDRRIRALRDSHLDDAVDKLDRSTQQARLVLADLKFVLSTEATTQANAVGAAEAMREELAVMVDIGNSVAERIMDAARQAQAVEAGARRRSVLSDDVLIDDGILNGEALPSPGLDLPGNVRGISPARFPRGSAVA
ncbi:MAG TPA: DUF6468 domain-containing protein [Novosphingobium sp.]|nr:DUF6468 domain-containing protein [Novosphingobium sp.]